MNDMLGMATRNLGMLRETSYPGRGLVIGRIGEVLVQLYWIMGRKENSRNRIFECDASGRVYTVPADPSKVKDPSLIIYNAMLEANENIFVVSNGDQTDTCMRQILVLDASLDAALLNRTFEPDPPHFTPRITGRLNLRGDPWVEIVILKRAKDGSRESHYFHYEDIPNNLGYCVTTYMGDGDPLPSFEGEPYLVPLSPDSEDFWDILNRENRVSLAEKKIFPNGKSIVRIFNKYTKVS